jgi:hypothetical protein
MAPDYREDMKRLLDRFSGPEGAVLRLEKIMARMAEDIAVISTTLERIERRLPERSDDSPVR